MVRAAGNWWTQYCPMAAPSAAPALRLFSNPMRRIYSAAVVVAGAAVLSMAAPALAHHSFAMFDADRTVVLNGSVKEVEWTNPHVWLRMMVADPASGKVLQYAVEMGSVARSTYDGWKPDTVKPGDSITVSMHPNKDGS